MTLRNNNTNVVQLAILVKNSHAGMLWRLHRWKAPLQ